MIEHKLRRIQHTPGDVFHRRLQGQQHVGAGIAVRDREHVEGVDLLPVGGQPGDRAEERFLKEASVARREAIDRELAELRERSAGMKAQWQSEKEAIEAMRDAHL